MQHRVAAREKKPAISLWAIIILLSGFATAACSSHEAPPATSTAPVASSTAVAPSATSVRKETKNPLPDLAAAATAGKALYETTCLACHGEGAKGDGPAAPALNPRPSDLTASKAQSQSDGELFLVVKQGKMENGKMMMQPIKMLTDEQIWQVIAYVRTLASK